MCDHELAGRVQRQILLVVARRGQGRRRRGGQAVHNMRLELLAQGPVGRQRFRTALRLCSSVCGACRRVQDAEEGVARLVEYKARIDMGEPQWDANERAQNRVNHIHRNGKTLRHFVVVRILRAHAGATGVWPTGQRSSASSCQNSSWAATRDGSSRTRNLSIRASAFAGRCSATRMVYFHVKAA